MRIAFLVGPYFLGMLRLNKRFQIRQIVLPEDAIRLQPRIHSLQWPGIQLVDTVATLATLFDQMGAAQEAQMFGYGGAGYRESLRNPTGWLASLPQQVENGPARGIGQGVEGRFRRVRNRTVPHNA